MEKKKTKETEEDDDYQSTKSIQKSTKEFFYIDHLFKKVSIEEKICAQFYLLENTIEYTHEQELQDKSISYFGKKNQFILRGGEDFPTKKLLVRRIILGVTIVLNQSNKI